MREILRGARSFQSALLTYAGNGMTQGSLWRIRRKHHAVEEIIRHQHGMVSLQPAPSTHEDLQLEHLLAPYAQTIAREISLRSSRLQHLDPEAKIVPFSYRNAELGRQPETP